MHLNHRLSICKSVLKKLTRVGSIPLNRANVPFIVPSIVEGKQKVNTQGVCTEKNIGESTLM